MSEWWTVATGAELEQGDLLFAVPVIRARAGAGSAARPQVDAEVRIVDAIVVTQTCDLRHARSADVLLARVVSWHDFAAAQFAAGNTAVKGTGYVENLIRGTVPPLTLLHERTKRPRLPWSIVDFRELHSVSRAHLDTHLAQAGSRQRLRLLSPYKEHFSQAFARYFMRVGLPHDAADLRVAGRQTVAALGRPAQ